MKFWSKSLIAVAVVTALTACSASAGEPANAKAIRTAIEKSLQRKVDSVATTPVNGVFEVVLEGNQVIYSTADGKYMFVGDLVDVAKRQSLTEARVAELTKVDVSKLPLENAIKDVRGNGKRTLYVFSDPDCPFCKKLERESLAGITNVTIYTFLFPLPTLHPDAERKSRLIWCDKNRTEAWKNWILNEKLPEGGKDDCQNPIQSNMALAQSLQISGTPALIFGDGRLVSGAIPKPQLEALLDKSGK
ncbi:DsbC family protein [Chitinibacteraceae bacterium HSL-7]